jgi:CRISPR-associated protein Cas5
MLTDISLLFEDIDRTVNAILTIEPLAPLSMVDSMPGNYYKTLEVPSKFHISGAFENILGWHFDENFKNHFPNDNKKTRSVIKKSVESYFKKLKLDLPVWEYSNSGYEPLVGHLFEIGLVLKPSMIHYNDLWKQMRVRKDGSYSHPNGTMNLSYEIIGEKMRLERKDSNDTVTNEAIAQFFETHELLYPMYYTGAGVREYVSIVQGSYKIGLKITEALFSSLCDALEFNNISYLGHSEGWVNIKIEKQ